MSQLEQEHAIHSLKNAVRPPVLPLTWKIWFWRQARKIVILVVGLTVVFLGLAGLLLPVLPGWLLIFAGLVILATEFAWARWILKVGRDRTAQLVELAKRQVAGEGERPPDSPG